MIEILKTVFLSLSVIDWALLYVLVGLVILLILIRGAMGDTDIFDDVKHSLGILVALSVVAWPYSVLLWVFSWDIWLKPVHFGWTKG
jgi:hypothetical protein